MLFGNNKELTSLRSQNKSFREDKEIISRFIKNLADGNYSEDILLPSQSEFSELSQQLLAFRDRLVKLKAEEQERKWISEGLADFVETLRVQDQDIQHFYDKIISDLVKYLGANQAALFVINEEDESDIYLQLVSTFAYDRKKFQEKRINPGDGMVGQCYLEKNSIYLTDIPGNYIKITSGLGTATPRVIFILPLIANEKVTGVLEIASFTQLEQYKRDFIVKLSESIASYISNIRVTEKTNKLLRSAQESTEMLRSQEEELRQNLEEMSALQEEIGIQLRESHTLKDALEIREKVFGHTTILTEGDRYGNIIYVNEKMCEVSGFSREELIGKPHNIVRHPDMPKELFRHLWETIKSGKVFNGIVKNRTKDGGHYWVDSTIVPIHDENGVFIKYIGARYHIKDEELAVKLFKQQGFDLAGSKAKV
jgi:methyl-accepting chemotaxis protein